MTNKVKNKFYSLISCLKNNKFLHDFLLYFNNVLFLLMTTFFLALDGLYPFNYFGRAFFAIFFVSSLFYLLIYEPHNLRLDFVSLSLLFFFVIIIISSILNGFSYSPFTPLSVTVLAIITYWWCSRDSANKNAIYAIILLATWLFFIILVVFNFRSLISFDFSSRDFASAFGNANDVAKKIMLSIAINIGLFFKSKKIWLKILSSIISIGFAYMVFLTGSMSNVMLLLILLVVTGYFIFPKGKKWLFFVFLLAALVLFAILINIPAFSYFKERLINIINSIFGLSYSEGSYDTSTIGRMRAAYYGLLLFLENPLFGAGNMGTTLNYYLMSHNNIVELLADFGIFGFLSIEILFILPFTTISKIKSNENKALVLLIVLYLFLDQFFLVSFNEKADMMWLMFVYSLIRNENQFLRKEISFFGRRIKKEVVDI